MCRNRDDLKPQSPNRPKSVAHQRQYEQRQQAACVNCKQSQRGPSPTGVHPHCCRAQYCRQDKYGRSSLARAATIYAGISRAQQKRGVKCQQYGIHVFVRPRTDARKRARLPQLNRLQPEERMEGMASEINFLQVTIPLRDRDFAVGMHKPFSRINHF